MQKKSVSLLYLVALSGALVALNFGCGGKVSSGSGAFGSIDVPSTAPATTPTSQDETDAGFFNVTAKFGNEKLANYIHKSTDFSSACAISKNATTSEDIQCIVEVPEGNLNASALSLNINAPPGMCEYLVETPYYFYNKPIGQGPEEINISFNVSTDASGAIIPAGTTSACTAKDLASNASTVPCSSIPDLIVGMSPMATYTATCAYGECCFGTRKITVTTTATNPSGDVSTNTVIDDKQWGPKNMLLCIGGLGKQGWGALSKDNNTPISALSPTAASGLNYARTLTSPISLVQSSNIHVANYSNPIMNQHRGFVSTRVSNLPYAIDPIDDLSGHLIPAANDSYTYECVDEAYETKHRIKVYIRDWDTMPDYTAFISSKGVTFNPDRPNDVSPAPNCDSLPGAACDYSDDWDDLLYRTIPYELGATAPYSPISYDTSAAASQDRSFYFPQLDY